MNSQIKTSILNPQGFPYWVDGGKLAPTSQKFAHTPLPPPRKIPSTVDPLPPSKVNSSPTKEVFSSYNPIKAAFLAVAIVPAQFLF